MNNSFISLKDELEHYNYSIDDFYIRIIIYMYEELKKEIQLKYGKKRNIPNYELKNAIRRKSIKMTRQTIYNLVNEKHDITDEKANIILNVLNEIKVENDDKPLTLDELSFRVYKRKR